MPCQNWGTALDLIFALNVSLSDRHTDFADVSRLLNHSLTMLAQVHTPEESNGNGLSSLFYSAALRETCF